MGLNPAWRKSLVYTTLGTGWQDGANSTVIDAARQLLVQDMKILEGIAPESGAYFNEVGNPPPLLSFFSYTHTLGFAIRIRLEEVLLRSPLR
jgi:hypothetical protein